MTSKPLLARTLEEGRRWTHRLLDVLDDDIVHTQFDQIMSPLVWDLGHIGNYEELWLLRRLGDPSFSDPRMDRVYDAFENPRWTRADLPILERHEAREYLQDIRAAVLRHLRSTEFDPEEPLLAGGLVYSLVAQHEAQHQETMLQALDLAAAGDPYPLLRHRWVPAARPVDDEARELVPGGPCTTGTDDAATSYDNERPRHVIDVPAFALDRYPVTARRYAAFIDSGGYDRPDVWSERGWSWRQETGCDAPQGWVRRDDAWWVQRLGHLLPIDPAEPVEHLSWFEAEAFARWAGGRLPTEHEWEKAASWDPAMGKARRYPWGDGAPSALHANLDRRGWGPAPVGSFPAGASAYGVEQLLGDVYEWTASDFTGYPEFCSFPYAEYSEVFLGGDYKVLRGASWASRACVARSTFRNWDHPYRRQIFAGVRVAWDV